MNTMDNRIKSFIDAFESERHPIPSGLMTQAEEMASMFIKKVDNGDCTLDDAIKQFVMDCHFDPIK